MAIWWHPTLVLFLTKLLTYFADSFVDLIMQRSLLDRQASCFSLRATILDVPSIDA